MKSFFEKKFEVRWSDVDPNMHARASAYMDYTDQVRVSFFDSQGLSLRKFQAMNLGPILFKSTCTFKREIHLSEIITINCKLAYLSEDYRKFKFIHEIFKENGELSCIVEVEGAWFDIAKRKVTSAPQEVIEAVKTVAV